MNRDVTAVLIMFALSSILSALFCYLFRAVALSFSITDNPDGHLKVHKKPVAYLGGAAIYAALFLTYFFWQIYGAFPILFFTGLMMTVGLYDDVYRLIPAYKFLLQTFIAAAYLFWDFTVHASSLALHVQIGLFIFFLLYHVTLTNAFNFVDVMDGQATILGLGALIIMFPYAWYYQLPELQLLGILGGTFVGFLVFNLPPASMYLGDAGSLYIGFILSIISKQIVESTVKINPFVATLMLGLPFCIPMLELVSLIIIRTLKHTPIYYGSKDHFCHYLQISGWTTQKILFYVANFCCATSLFVALGTVYSFSLWSFILFGGLQFFCWLFILIRAGLLRNLPIDYRVCCFFKKQQNLRGKKS